MKKLIILFALVVVSATVSAQADKYYGKNYGSSKSRSSSKKSYKKSYATSSNTISLANSNGKKDEIWHILYMNSLKEGDKGAYGFGTDGIGTESSIGGSMRMMTNAFLVHSEEFNIKTSFGINYHAPLDDFGYFVFPVMLGCFGYEKQTYNQEKNKIEKDFKFGFDIEAMPYIAFGRNGGISVGPFCIYSFVTEKASWGGHISIWF